MEIANLFLDVALCVLVLASLASLGRRMLSAFSLPTDPPLWAFSAGLAAGISVFMFFMLLLTFAGLLRSYYVLPVYALLLIGGSKDIYGWTRKAFSSRPDKFFLDQELFVKIALLLFLITAASNLIRSNAPPITDDELSYHLYAPKSYVKTGSWAPPPVDHYPNYYPQSPEIIYASLMLFRRDITPAIFHFLLGIACLAPLFLIARRFMSGKYALLACIIFYTMPRFTSLTYLAYTDMFILLISLAALEMYLLWRQTENRRWLYACALLLSSALAGKLSALAMVFAFGAMYVLDDWGSGKNFRKVFSLFIFAVICTFILYLPWFLRNYIYKGNIFYPFSFFGTKGDEMAKIIQASESIGRMGKLKMLLCLPYTIFTYDFSQGSGPLLMFFPLAFFLRPLPGTAKKILLFSFFQIIGCLALLHYVGFHRYILMSHALLACVAAFAFCAVEECSPRMLSFFFKSAFIAALIMPCLTFSLGGAMKRLPFTTGKISRDGYLQKYYDQEGYDTVLFCNKNLPKNARILLIYGDCSRPYYYEKDLVFLNSVKTMNSAGLTAITPYLEEQGITHVLLVNYFGWQKDPGGVWTWTSGLFKLSWLKDGEDKGFFRKIFDNGKAEIYSIKGKT